MSFLYQALWVLVTQLLKLYDFFKLPLCVGCLYQSDKAIELTQMVLWLQDQNMENYSIEGKKGSYFTSVPIKSWETHCDTIMLDRAEQTLPKNCWVIGNNAIRAVRFIPSYCSLVNEALGSCDVLHIRSTRAILTHRQLICTHLCPSPCGLHVPAIRAADTQGWVLCLSQWTAVDRIPQRLGCAGLWGQLAGLNELLTRPTWEGGGIHRCLPNLISLKKPTNILIACHSTGNVLII